VQGVLGAKSAIALFRQHSQQKSRPIVTDVLWPGCLSVGNNREPYRTAEPIQMPFRLWTQVGPKIRERVEV